jgi:FtsH-binding integral membrane protein
MVNTNPFLRSATGYGDRVGFDAGLRAHMQRVFMLMAGALGVTGAIAFLVANTPMAQAIFGSPLKWLVMLAPLGFIFFLQFRWEKMSLAGLQGTFWAFSGVMGLSLASIFLVYTNESIARAFFITGATFAAMSLWGYTTKRDLSSMGAFLMMGMLGLFIAGLVNLFLQSSMLQWIVSVVGVGVFTLMTAFDVQRIKQSYAESWGAEANGKLAVMGALGLYLNFINAFQMLLSLIGNREE